LEEVVVVDYEYNKGTKMESPNSEFSSDAQNLLSIAIGSSGK
jgi:hypothetical protein